MLLLCVCVCLFVCSFFSVFGCLWGPYKVVFLLYEVPMGGLWGLYGTPICLPEFFPF